MLVDTIYQGTTSEVVGSEPEATGRSAWSAGAVPPRALGGRPSRAAGSSGPTGRGWIDCDEREGVIEIHDPRLLRRGQEAFCRALVEAAVERFGARWAGVTLETSTCRIAFPPGDRDRAEMARRVALAVHAAIPSVCNESAARAEAREAPIPAGPAAATGAEGEIEDIEEGPSSRRRRRLWHAALAGGSFALTIGGIVLPGVPTLPFLLMTGRQAALASPRIERWLRRQPWCAAMLEDAEESSGSPIDWRSLLGMIALAALCVAGIWFLHPPLPVILLLEVGLMALLACWDWLGSLRAEVAPAVAA